ncbi:BTAD domain-containing putative transcriptional regulator [Actinophytocola sp.]|uniref:BTAD domain-containing putative transcriptional regulator n=1 Tax=Actinophytocola sp. TaxID=1872138 RepID=UPI002D7F5316|nr:BTAD domain-containing putative transcriptional regulator [Actinophytocola sp.]HET9139659.1 BTAD domain-containing putative transcriptional regulator [Actinophytocola sp.]
MDVRVAMLGPLRLAADDGSAIEVGGARLRMLLVRLALEAGRVVSTESLIDGLWGDNPPGDANNALQSLVSRLRRSLGADNGGLVESHPAGYRLAVSRDDVDVYRFEGLAEQGREQLRAGRSEQAAGSLRAALELWRGTPLADVAEAPFAQAAGARLAELQASALEDRVEADLQLGRHQEVLPELRNRLAEQPLRERLAGLLIRALYQAGRQADALEVYEGTRRALADELGVEPSAELRRVHLAVLRGEEQQDRGRSRLPARLTSFVGRHAELTGVRERLGAARLVTLAGPGGAGKTRLATEVAAATGMPAWFVELAAVSESGDVPGAILTSLDLREVRVLESTAAHRPLDPMDRLSEALAGQHGLIVLDNCEHLITAAAEVADRLLTRCPGLRILATSREPLAVTGEAVFPLGSLELPEPAAPLDDARATEAVRLFTDRAAAAHPGFAVDADNVATVVEICRRLDGLPLALELAAARLRSMTLAQIAANLDDRFRLLTGGSRSSMPRHRTLRAVVDWSWDLLEKPERILARRLAVFAAPASLESATAVCADDTLPAGDILYVLASLVEKSLVQAVGAAGEPRYRMLETVRAYAAGQLAESGESDLVHDRYGRFYLAMAEEIDPLLRGSDQLRSMARMVGEQENLLAALRHATDSGDADLAVRLALASGWYWALSGRFREVTSLVARVVELPGPAPAAARATLRVVAAMGGPGMPEREVVQSIRAELAETDAMMHHPMLAMVEPMLAAFSGDMPAAWAALDRAENHPDPWGRAAIHLGRAFLAENTGMVEVAERASLAALAAFRALGDRWGQTLALGQISERRTLRADHAGAIEAYLEAIRLASELGSFDDLPELRARLAAQRVRAGDLAGAEQDLRAGLAAARERASVESEAMLLCGLANVARRRGDLAAAREHLRTSRTLLSGLARPDGHWRAMYETTVASIEVAAGEREVARTALRHALTAMTEMMDLPLIAGIAEGAAHLLLGAGDAAGAARLLGAGTALRGTPDLGNPELDELTDELTATLGPEGYRDAYERGLGLDRDHALAALTEVLAEAQPTRRL